MIKVIQPAQRNVTPWGHNMSDYSDYIHRPGFQEIDNPALKPVTNAYRRAKGRDPAPTDVGHGIWGLTFENKTIWQLEAEWKEARPPVAPAAPGRRGIDIPIGELTGGWLYVDPFWAPANVFAGDEGTFTRIIRECKAYGNICVSVVNFLGTDQYSPTFRGTQHHDRVRDRLALIDQAGVANVVFGFGNDYLKQDLGFPNRSDWPQRLYNETRRIGELIAPWTSVYIPLTERGKTLTSRYNEERHKMYLAAREGMADRGVIGAHELPGDGVYFEDLKHCGDVMACIQTGFDRSVDEIRDWVRDDVRRWRDLDARGNFTGRAWHCAFEHSIPPVDPGRWRHYQTWDEAKRRGRACLDAGADLDFSGGQRR